MSWEPSISLTTTFERSLDDKALYTYSRSGNPNLSKLEFELNSIMKGHSIAYSSGMAATIASLIYYKPKRVLIIKGYYFTLKAMELINQLYPIETISLTKDTELKKGDILFIENPVNPTGEIINLNYYTNKVQQFKKHNIFIPIICDATLAPPPLFDPFEYGVDLILHSATKFLGGHSDVLAGVLVTKDEKIKDQLLFQRSILGSILGNLESYLLLRSLKTLELRVNQQSTTCLKLVSFLNILKDQVPYNKLIYIIKHSSLQQEDYVKQYNIHSPVFSILFQTKQQARILPFKFNVIKSATSIGGSKTLIEWRHQFDLHLDPRLCRVSVGLEKFELLKMDLINGFNTFLIGNNKI